jgi:hypothetical protein
MKTLFLLIGILFTVLTNSQVISSSIEVEPSFEYLEKEDPEKQYLDFPKVVLPDSLKDSRVYYEVVSPGDGLMCIYSYLNLDESDKWYNRDTSGDYFCKESNFGSNIIGSYNAEKDSVRLFIFDTGAQDAVEFTLLTIDSIPTGIDNNPISFIVYPNPCRNWIYINTEESLGIVKIRIVDYMGNVVKIRERDSSVEMKIGLKKLQRGIYFIEVIAGERVGTTKIIKQ